MKAIFTTLALVILGGCATQPRQVMQDSQYQEFANLRAGVENCGITGKMAPEVAALGLTYLDSSLNRFTYDHDRLTVAFRSLGPISTSTEYCNRQAMEIHNTRQRIAVNNAQVQANQQAIQNMINNRPRQTYCNRIGTQTLCNTY